MRAATIPILFFTTLLAAGCGDGGKETPPGTLAPLPCFAEAGPMLCRINGVAVPRATLDRFKAWYRSWNPTWSDRQATFNTLERILIPRAVGYAAAGEGRVAEVSARIREAYERLMAHEPFDEVARRYSNDAGSAAQGGLFGAVEEGQTSNFGAAFLDTAWTLPVGVVSEPFMELYGAAIVKVSEAAPGKGMVKAKRTIWGIVVLFFPEEGFDFKTASQSAKVTEISDPAFEVLVPEVYKRAGGTPSGSPTGR